MQHQVGATNPTSALEKFRKLDPPTFKGTKDPIKVDNCLGQWRLVMNNELSLLFLY